MTAFLIIFLIILFFGHLVLDYCFYSLLKFIIILISQLVQIVSGSQTLLKRPILYLFLAGFMFLDAEGLDADKNTSISYINGTNFNSKSLLQTLVPGQEVGYGDLKTQSVQITLLEGFETELKEFDQDYNFNK